VKIIMAIEFWIKRDVVEGSFFGGIAMVSFIDMLDLKVIYTNTVINGVHHYLFQEDQ
jgi:hypothetical protein